MHELFIAESILGSVKASLPEGIAPAAVRQVTVKVGKLDAVVPDSLIFLFEAVKGNHGMPSATLEIEEEAVLCECQSCKHNFSVEFPLFLCPECGSGDVKVLKGRGITLLRIMAEED